MRNKVIGLVVLSSMLTATAYCQVKTTTQDDDAYAKKISQLYVKSGEVVLPDSVYVILKDLAFKQNISEALVVKQAYIIKIIYNDKLSREDRILACDHILNHFSAPGNIIPLFLVTEMKNKLIASK